MDALEPNANNPVSRGDRGNRYQIEDAVFLQTRNLLIRCCLPMRRLGKAHGLLEGVRDTVRFSLSRTARVRVSHGIGDVSGNPRHEADAQYTACPCWRRNLIVAARAACSAENVPPKPRGCCCCCCCCCYCCCWGVLSCNGLPRPSTPRQHAA